MYTHIAGLRSAHRVSGLALTIAFGMAVMLNIVPFLSAWFQAGNSEGWVMKMIGSRWFGLVSAAALVGSSVLSSVIANAAPV